MDFREHQDSAKANSSKIWGLYFTLLAFTSLLLASLLPVLMQSVEYFYALSINEPILFLPGLIELFKNWELILIAAGVSATIIGFTSLVGMFRSSNGHDVAQSMGGRKVGFAEDALNDSEVMALNIIDELSLAASIPAPALYIIPDVSVNAFAAGKNADQAVIGITEGALSLFNREELSGVVAHEVGHIVNNDIALNIKISSFVFGFTAIFFLARMLYYSALLGDHRDFKARLSMFAFSAAVALVGVLSVFAGRILQAMMSRQREYLADASAVQFTRNTGLKKAFLKIQEASSPTQLETPIAGENAHAFIFNTGSSLFSTHPQMSDRISRLNGENRS